MSGLLEVISAMIYQKKYLEVKEILSLENAADLAVLFQELFGEDFEEQKEFVILFRLLPKDLAAETFVYMDSDMQEFLINAFTDVELKEILEQSFIDDTVDNSFSIVSNFLFLFILDSILHNEV